VFRDVSELRAAQRQKDEFISVVSHELRTPLTSVRGALGLLAGGALGPLEPKALDVVQIASSNADRLSRLINDMLDIERLESGKALLRLETENLRTLIDETLEENRVMADQAGIALRAACPASLPVLVDPDRLRQILTNLVSNAVKFSEPGQEVLVRGHTRDGQVQVDVVDQGRGIPPSHREKIFGRFEQVDASDSRRKGGTGLGLAICDGLVRQHGGRIWVESTLGEGSTFSFTLPQPTSAHKTRGHGPPVLIISGDDVVGETAMSILAANGYQAVTAASAEQGINQAISGHPMVIVVDALLPDADGWEVAATLAAHDETARTTVIILGTESPPSPGSAPVQVHGCLDRSLIERDLLGTVNSAIAGPGGLPIVLVVEDDLDLAEVMTTGFSDRGVRAAHAASAAEARAWCERALPNAILLDLNLRDGSGVNVLDWLRDHNRLDRVAVAVYTLLDVDAAELRRIGVGMDRVFVKSRATPEAVQDRVLEIMKQAMEEKVGV
jgi:DNA-binding response OmpR family regulator